MEDAATAEISRAQVWQWWHGARLEDGRTVDLALCRAVLAKELVKLRSASTGGDRYEDAAALFDELMAAPSFPDFLTLPAYERITAGLWSGDAAAPATAGQGASKTHEPSLVD
jgi:malate synthase